MRGTLQFKCGVLLFKCGERYCSNMYTLLSKRRPNFTSVQPSGKLRNKELLRTNLQVNCIMMFHRFSTIDSYALKFLASALRENLEMFSKN